VEVPQVEVPQVEVPQVEVPLVEAQLVEPQLVEPQLVEPQLAEPRPVEVPLVEVPLVEPQLVEPQLVEAPLVEVQLVEVQLVEVQLVEALLLTLGVLAIGTATTFQMRSMPAPRPEMSLRADGSGPQRLMRRPGTTPPIHSPSTARGTRLVLPTSWAAWTVPSRRGRRTPTRPRPGPKCSRWSSPPQCMLQLFEFTKSNRRAPRVGSYSNSTSSIPMAGFIRMLRFPWTRRCVGIGSTPRLRRRAIS
jgi:hypothetical protein